MPSFSKWLSISPKIDVQKWLSTTPNLVTQRHNSWNNQYVTITIVSITQRYNSRNSHCQFYEDTIHKIVNFSYRSCLQQFAYKLLKRNLIVSYVHKTLMEYEDKMENQCIDVLNAHF